MKNAVLDFDSYSKHGFRTSSLIQKDPCRVSLREIVVNLATIVALKKYCIISISDQSNTDGAGRHTALGSATYLTLICVSSLRFTLRFTLLLLYVCNSNLSRCGGVRYSRDRSFSR